MLFHHLLKEPSYRRDLYTNDLLTPYTEILEIFISEDEFYRYGWELSKTNVIVFGKFFETRAKFFMRNIVGVYRGLGLPIFRSIARFQKTFNFDEDAWKYESIKKDFYRHGNTRHIDFDNEIYHKIENIILDNLLSVGKTRWTPGHKGRTERSTHARQTETKREGRGKADGRRRREGEGSGERKDEKRENGVAEKLAENQTPNQDRHYLFETAAQRRARPEPA